VDSFTLYLDDAGNSSFMSKNRFWVLGGVVVPDSWWSRLYEEVRTVLRNWDVSDQAELKWSDCGIRIKQIETTDSRQMPKKQTAIEHLTTKRDVRQLYFDLLDTLNELPRIRVMCVWCVKQEAKQVCRWASDPDERCYRD
jgi:hypothetical protein